MNKYAQTALIAAEFVTNGSDPETAWVKASCIIFEPNTPAQKKGCPKNAFLGLYNTSQKINSENAIYAQKAVRFLKNNPMSHITAADLWNIVLEGESKKHNSQMYVVMALWEAGYIK